MIINGFSGGGYSNNEQISQMNRIPRMGNGSICSALSGTGPAWVNKFSQGQGHLLASSTYTGGTTVNFNRAYTPQGGTGTYYGAMLGEWSVYLPQEYWYTPYQLVIHIWNDGVQSPEFTINGSGRYFPTAVMWSAIQCPFLNLSNHTETLKWGVGDASDGAIGDTTWSTNIYWSSNTINYYLVAGYGAVAPTTSSVSGMNGIGYLFATSDPVYLMFFVNGTTSAGTGLAPGNVFFEARAFFHNLLPMSS